MGRSSSSRRATAWREALESASVCVKERGDKREFSPMSRVAFERYAKGLVCSSAPSALADRGPRCRRNSSAARPRRGRVAQAGSQAGAERSITRMRSQRPPFYGEGFNLIPVDEPRTARRPQAQLLELAGQGVPLGWVVIEPRLVNAADVLRHELPEEQPEQDELRGQARGD